MSRNRKIALVCFIIAFLSAVWLLKCNDDKKPSKADKKQEEAVRHQRDGIPPAPPQQPPS